MGLLQFAERFFPKTYIGIWNNNGIYDLSIRRIYPSGKIESEMLSFDADVETEKLFEYLEKVQGENIVTYIAILDQSLIQGALPVEGKIKFLEFDEIKKINDFNDVFFREMGGWAIYTSNSELLKIQNQFNNSGIDFIFSPFLIPVSARENLKLSKNASIFIIAEKNLIIFTIFKGEKLLFGELIKDVDGNELIIDEVKNELDEMLENLSTVQHMPSKIETLAKHKSQADSAFFDEGAIELDLLDSDIKHSTPEDDEKLQDELLKLDFADSREQKNSTADSNANNKKKTNSIELEKMLTEGLEEELKAEEERMHESEVNHKLLYFAIQKNVNRFYHDKLYSSDFIENCYILTGLKVDGNFLSKIESEFSFETEKIRVDLAELIVQMIGEEIAHKI